MGARLEIPDKLLKPTFPPSPYTALRPHTPINSSPLPGLAHWNNLKGLSTGVESRLDPYPQRMNEHYHVTASSSNIITRNWVMSQFRVILLDDLAMSWSVGLSVT